MTEQTGNSKPNEAEGLAFPLSGNEKLIESVRDWPTITRMSHSTQLEKLVELRDALEAAEKALTPTDDEVEALRIAHLDARQAAYRKEREDWYVDHEAEPEIASNAFFRGWDAAVDGGFRRSEVTPTDDERKAIAQVILPVFDQLASAVYGDGPYSEAESALEAADLLSAAGFRRSVVPEPSAEVLSDWFTSSHGVAVAAVKPMTDRGPSVMVDGRVISPNDVAALIEFKAQPEPSDAQVEAAWSVLEQNGLTVLERSNVRAALRAAGVVTQEGEPNRA
ncbi:hypothetical protein ILP86_04620 [Microbacterium sp. R1]|uniref:Uncharacterized protein n=1 Tax=Microbacterium phage vB_MoxS-R1 TaxID=2848881 RepID=A0A8F2E4K0_9CAUD|nr:hypothetical protein [Microbacterium sp. R1]YP_010649912.1 hypothetical protein PP419_gp32 [Microbacterium phage vB_MoxS-R1]MBE7953604.1 hypothetical protein [Microbacterium sp. R1]QWT28882.1 hypothetical protein vBMoxSR1_gp32 [Microbacterium phage vB_MoxS-R1]